MKIICIGLIVNDIIARPVEKDCLEKDSSFLDTLILRTGGDAFNTAVNLSVLGEKVELIGKVGADPFGYEMIRKAEKWKVGTGHILLEPKRSTSTSIVLIEPNGERHFLYYGGTNNLLSAKDVKTELFQEGDIVHLGSAMALRGLSGAGLAGLFQEAKKKGCTTSMDVTNDETGKWLDNIEAALHDTDIFLPSDYEAIQIAGTDDLREIREFFKRFGIKILVVKRGKKGCYVTDFKDEFTIPPLNGNVIDTTGAGDAFVSGFLKGVARGYSVKQCAVLGNQIAAACISELGAVDGVIKRYKDPLETQMLLDKIKQEIS